MTAGVICEDKLQINKKTELSLSNFMLYFDPCIHSDIKLCIN